MRYARAHVYSTLFSVWSDFRLTLCSKMFRWTRCDLDSISAVRLCLSLGQWDDVCLAADHLTIRALVWVRFLTNASVMSVCDHTSTETPLVLHWVCLHGQQNRIYKAHLHSCVYQTLLSRIKLQGNDACVQCRQVCLNWADLYLVKFTF